MKNLLKILLLLLLGAGNVKADNEPGNNLPATTTDVISLGIAQSGSLGSSGDNYDYYQLTTAADGNIVISASNDNNAFIYIYLYDNDGTTQLGSASGYGLSSISLTTNGLQAGTYYAMIYGSSLNNYTLNATIVTPVLSNDTEPNNTPALAASVSLSTPVTGHIAYRANGGAVDNYDYYSLSTNADGDVNLNFSNDNNAFCYIYLYDSDGFTQLNAISGYGLGGFSLTTTGLAAGTYYMAVYSASYCGYTFGASLSPNPIPGDPTSNSHFINAPSFAQNDSINGHIAYRNNGGSYDNYDYYSFYSNGDYDITISLKNNNNAFTYIYLYDTDTITQLGTISGYAQGTISFTTTGLAAGTYYIAVYAGPGAYSGYTLKNSYTANPLVDDPEPNNNPAQATPFNVNSSVTGHIAYRNTGGSFDNYDSYQLVTTEDGNIQIALNNTNNAFTYVYLYDNNGATQLGSASGYAQAGISFTVNGLAAGTYYVVVYAGGGSYSGYTLSNTLFVTPYTNDTEDNSSFANAQPLNNSPIKSGHIGHRYNGGAIDYYDYRKITMLNADSLRIELSFNNSNFAYVYLYNPVQNQIYSNSGYGGAYVIFFNSLPAGDYYLVVYGSSYNAYLINKFYFPCDPSSSLITAGGPTSFCDGGSVSLNAANAYNSYLWSTGATTGSISTGSSGNYLLTAFDFDGCPHASNTIAVNALPNTSYYLDADGDGFGNSGSSLSSCTGAPSGYVLNSSDCNDGDVAINPAANEVCNAIDDNCNGSTDEGLTLITYYIDADNDGYGSLAATQSTCNGAPAGYVGNSTDCNDANNSIYPAATELCNGIDDNCNGSTDEGCTSYTYFADADGDGFGDPGMSISSQNPLPPSGYVVSNSDCNDGNASINPAAVEACNSIDDNCNSLTDDGLTYASYYADADGDGFGNASLSQNTCNGAPSGYVANNSDCNDNNSSINPGASEICNNTDDNCNGLTDDGLVFSSYYADADGDGYGNASMSQNTCSGAPSGYVADYSDCNDANGAIYPGTTELCNGIDDNCNGTTDEGCGACAAPGPISGPAHLCAPTGQQITYSVAAIPGATSYLWTVPAGTIIVSGQGTTTLVVRWPFQTIHSGLSGDICVSYSAPCGNSAPSCLSITVQLAIPVRPASISGSNKACSGDVFTYSTALVPRASLYNWTVPAGALILSGNGTNSISVQYDASFTGGQITVNASNGCGTSPERSKDISRNILRAPASINGLTKGVCGASGVGYTCTPVPGASSYQWTVPAGASIASGQGSSSITVNYGGSFLSGTVSVYAINNCGGGASRIINVAGAPAIPGQITGATSTCTNQIYVYEVQAIPGTSSYNWTLPSHLQIISGQGTKTLTVQTGLNAVADFAISVKCSNSCGTSPASKLEHISSSSCPRIGNSTSISGISSYPNPASDAINISFASSKDQELTIQLFDAAGRLVYNSRVTCFENENLIRIDVSGFTSGIYTLGIRNEQAILYNKIVVE